MRYNNNLAASPSTLLYDLADRCTVYTVEQPQLPIPQEPRGVQVSDLLYLSWCQLRATWRLGVSTFFFAIQHIRFLISQKEVTRPDTIGSVTFVENKRLTWLSIFNIPAYPMSIVTNIIECKHSIAISQCSPSPEPAGISFNNLFPKMLNLYLGKIWNNSTICSSHEAIVL